MNKEIFEDLVDEVIKLIEYDDYIMINVEEFKSIIYEKLRLEDECNEELEKLYYVLNKFM